MKKLKKLSTLTLSFAIALIVLVSCEEKLVSEEPGPIFVSLELLPSHYLDDGQNARIKISVKNVGATVEVSKIHVRESCISGWLEGEVIEGDIEINATVPAHSTEIIYDQTITVKNTGPDDLHLTLSVTVYSTAGQVKDVLFYTIHCAKKKSTDSVSYEFLGIIKDSK